MQSRARGPAAGVIAGSLVFSALGLAGAAPAAAQPTCGSVVTTSVTLTADLLNCPGDGLVIGASGITVDLGARVVQGSAGTGILNSGFSDVTIKNGTVEGFQRGVALLGGTGSTVQGIEISRSSNAGLLLDGSSHNRLEDNTVDGSGDTAVHLVAASDNTLAGNTVTNSSDFAIWLEQGSNRNVLQGNTVASSSSGIEVQDSDGNELTGNTATGLGEAGISLANANDSIVKNNKVGGNPSGLRLSFSSNNHVEGNDASGSTSTGIELGDGSLDNVLLGNVSNNNAARGIVVSLEAPEGSGTLIEANTASGNKDDGIHVAKGGHTITGNTANNNAKYGIWAGSGNTDGGGNVATGNAEALQCHGVSCSDGATPPPPPPPDPDPTDTTAPVVGTVSGPDQDTASTAAFTFTGSDDVTTPEHLAYECRLHETQPDPALAWTGCTSPWQVPLPEVGSYILELRATDTAGNVSSPKEHPFDVAADTTAPETSFTQTPADSTTGTSATFAFTGEDPSPSNGSMLDSTPAEYLGFECRLDDGVAEPDPTEAWLECASPHTFSNLAPGTHTVEVRAVDAANNVDPSPASQTWTMQEGTPTQPPPPPEPTGTTTVTCGQVLTASTRVGNDLTDCSGEGLVIGAPNIVLDLGGHTVGGHLTVAPGEETGLPAGIRNGGHSNVVVKNGTVTGFGYGVRLMGPAAYNVVEAMTFLDNQLAGVELVDADNGSAGNTIRNNAFTANGGAVALIQGSQNSVVSGNTMTGNAGMSVLVRDSSGHEITGNTISGKMTNPLLGSDAGVYLYNATNNSISGNEVTQTGDAGVVLSTGSHNNTISTNTITQTGGSAISVAGSDGTQVLDNVGHLAAGAAISIGGNDSTVDGNDVRYNPGGIRVAGSGNTVNANDVTGAEGTGITVELGLGNQITNNLANQTKAVGIAVTVEAVDTSGSPIPGNLIQGNTANQNSDDGIYVARGGHTIKGNAAHNNAALGISAGEGVIDGGGNTASGNAKLEQCVNVLCDSSGSVPLEPADSTGPETVFTETPTNPSGPSATFRFTGSDDTTPTTALRFECRFDPAPDPTPPPGSADPTDPNTWTGCSSPMTYNDLTLDEHTFQVRAIDATGNRDYTHLDHTWQVADLSGQPTPTPPETTIDSGPAASTAETTATFTFSADVADSTFECSLDGATFTACASPQPYTGLAVGSHTFAVQAMDPDGEVDTTPAQYTWEVIGEPDTTAPETTIDSGTAATTTDTTASFVFSSSEVGSTFTCSMDGAAFEACTSPKAYTGLTAGSHTFQVAATDAAGNTDPTPATWTWTIEASCAAGSVTVGAAADSWIHSKDSRKNFGGDSILKVTTKSGENTRALVRFALPTVPTDCEVTDVQLRLYNASPKPGRSIQALQLSGGWTENGVTWAKQPATTGTAVAATTPASSAWMQWTVTEQVQAMYSSGAAHGFLVRDAAEGGGGEEQQFHSREKAPDRPPQLVVTFG